LCIARHVFGFEKGCQFFIRAHYVAFAIVAVRINNEDVAPSSLTTATHPQLQPDLLRRSAIISQYFIFFSDVCRSHLMAQMFVLVLLWEALALLALPRLRDAAGHCAAR
jgi:hypothetical protein